jgi:hypothetical protein
VNLEKTLQFPVKRIWNFYKTVLKYCLGRKERYKGFTAHKKNSNGKK